MKRKMLIVCSMLFFLLLMAVASDAHAATKANAWNNGKKEVQVKGPFTYYAHPSKNGKEAWIYKIQIKKGKKKKNLTIPKTIHGKKVTRLGMPDGKKADLCTTLFGTHIQPWHNWDASFLNTVATIKSVKIPDTVEVIEDSSFSGLDSVTTIKLPQKVKKIGKYTFYGCDKLKTIVLPDRLEKFENSSLMDCPSLKNIKLSKKNKVFQIKGGCLIRKKDKALVYAAPIGKNMTIPDGTKKILSYAFNNSMSPEVKIPASVTQIERAAFEGLYAHNMYIKNVTVSDANPVYARDGQCIYVKQDRSLAIVIPDKKGELRISELVEKLTPEISLVNCNTDELGLEAYLEKVVYPSRLKYVTAPAFNRINANNVYFTGSTPPEVTVPESVDESVLPTCCQVYVPAAYEEAYRSWYKTYGYDIDMYLDGWHTFIP